MDESFIYSLFVGKPLFRMPQSAAFPSACGTVWLRERLEAAANWLLPLSCCAACTLGAASHLF